MLIKTNNFSPKELASFKHYQKLSFDILQSVADSLKEGDSEKDVARKLVKKYRQAGAKTFFHLPVVLFGDRTTLSGDWKIKHFFPKRNNLKMNDSVIFDAAPLFNGFLVDTSLSFCFGRSSEHDAMMLHLAYYRDSIPIAINEGATFKNITEQVGKTMLESGYKPAHQKHPGEVLGHRAIRTPNFLLRPKIQGFDAISLSWFRLKDSIAMKSFGNKSPLWNASNTSNHPAHDGLWLVEPHASKGNIGAKWEEILVIENGQARWLQDRPPHVIYWERLTLPD